MVPNGESTMNDRQRFVAIAPPLICVLALLALILVMVGAELAAQIVTSALTFVGALALLWFSRDRWAEWSAEDKAFSITLALLLLYASFAVPVAVTVADSAAKYPVIAVGIVLTATVCVLLIRRTMREARGSNGE